MLYINTLSRLLPPPATPLETPVDEDWHPVEIRIGLEFPPDYKEFIAYYGTGTVDNFLWVLNPFSKNMHLNFSNKGSLILLSLKELVYESIPYQIYHNSAGIIPWCITDNGDVIYWNCGKPPSSWSIVVNESRGPRWREYDLSSVDFLTKILTRELIVDVFPEDFPSDSPDFIQTA